MSSGPSPKEVLQPKMHLWQVMLYSAIPVVNTVMNLTSTACIVSIIVITDAHSGIEQVHHGCIKSQACVLLVHF